MPRPSRGSFPRNKPYRRLPRQQPYSKTLTKFKYRLNINKYRKKRPYNTYDNMKPVRVGSIWRAPKNISHTYTYWTWRNTNSGTNTVGAPLTIYNLTDYSQYIKRFDAEQVNSQPLAYITNCLLNYQIDAVPTTIQPCNVHVYIVSPKPLKLQSTAVYTYMTTTDVKLDFDAQPDGSNPFFNKQLYNLYYHKVHNIGKTTAEATASTSQRSQQAYINILPMRRLIKSINGSSWKTTNIEDTPFLRQIYLLLYVEVADGTTTPLQFSFNSNLTIKQNV